MDLLKVIQERRSIREFREESIPEEILIEVLEAARWSPSWANTQTWRFVVVKDQEKKARLQETLSANNPARNALIKAPVVICLVAQKGVSGFHKGNPATSKGDCWFMFDAGIAMEHIVLAAWNFGLGTCHVGLFDGEKADEVLQVSEGYTIVEMTPLGYFDAPGRQTPRKPMKDIVFLDTFGESFLP